MPLYDSHAYFQDERRGENRKTETRVCHQIPSGRLCFLAFQSDVVLRPCVWPWLLNPASSTQPQFKTRVWEAPSSLTQFSEFSAWLWWEMYESLLCAFLKAHPSQMALCRVATAARDSHRWRTQKRTFEGDHFRSTCCCELFFSHCWLFPTFLGVCKFPISLMDIPAFCSLFSRLRQNTSSSEKKSFSFCCQANQS